MGLAQLSKPEKKGVNKKSLANLKGQGVVSRDVLYKKMSRLAPTAIEKLELLMESKNENIQLGAINKVLDKTLPNLETDKGAINIQVNVQPILGGKTKE